MKTYFIYDMNTEELLGTVETTSIESAERKASELLTTNQTNCLHLQKGFKEGDKRNGKILQSSRNQ